jgi:hypothetical protein
MILKPRLSGVMAAKLEGLLKKSQASDSEIGIFCTVLIVYTLDIIAV